MNTEEKLAIIKQNCAEIVTEEELVKLLQEKESPSVYCGYEPNGPMHLGHFVTITKLMDLARAGFKVKVLLADVHAFLNRKGSEDDIKKEVANWRKTIKAIGLDAEVVLGSSFQYDRDYQLDVMRLAQASTINRGLRSMQEIARDVENATISQLWYPLMQCVDIKYLKVDVAEGGLEQRKVHMIGRDEAKTLDYKFIALHTPLITSLKGPGQKMSKSIPGSGISVVDSKDEVVKTIKAAYCPEKSAVDNPILQVAQLIIFPRIKEFKIERPAKFGGNIELASYAELEEAFVAGKVHPLDLKNSVSKYIEQVIAPIRANY
jgi:tyrosyl-tRNA synthetase